MATITGSGGGPTSGGGTSGTGGGSAGGLGSGGGYVLMTGPNGEQVVSLAAGDPCAGASLLLAEANRLIGTCTDLLNANPPLPPFTEAACRQRLPSCTQSDRQFGDQYLNCLRRLDPCNASNRGSLAARERVCQMYAAGISQNCFISLRY